MNLVIGSSAASVLANCSSILKEDTRVIITSLDFETPLS